MRIPLLFFWLLVSLRALAGSEIEFRADFYTRDLSTDKLHGKGHAWVKREDREVWADEVEVDFKSKIVTGTGHVHIREGATDIWCERAVYELGGEKGTMEDAILIRDQMVITGKHVRKVSRETFEAEDGTYSNCNVSLEKSPDVRRCQLDWHFSGRHFTVTTESYAQFTDAILYIRDAPILYTPYFIVPAKSKRQSGFLLPNFSASANLGSGATFPFFWNLGRWHDLTITPTFHSKTGHHVGLDYRYVYSPDSAGRIQFFFTGRRFSSDVNNPANNDPTKPRLLSAIGEWAISAENHFPFGTRGQSRQSIQLVSHPYYTQDYFNDLGVSPYSAYLRSQASVTLPSDHWLATGLVRHHQSLVLSKDTDSDKGAVVQLPSVGLFHTGTPLLDRYLSWELDAKADHFFRSPQFDSIPPAPAKSGSNQDPDGAYDANDYLRSGRRMQIEPRLIAHVPMPPGFQLQPVVAAGSLFYHFDLPSAGVVHREYLQAEIPLSLYLSRRIDTSIPGFETLSHVIQPRVIYAKSLYDHVSDPAHPFFYQSGLLSNPRFDVTDQFSEFEYMRFELINRLRRKVGDSRERFFLLQLSQQYNLRTFPNDPRFQRRLGPIEIFSEMTLWHFALQLQATYDLETSLNSSGEGIHEANWSSSLVYSKEKDHVRLNSLIRTKADRSLSEQSLYLDFYKTLPLFFDVDGRAEYSMKGPGLLGYDLGFYFESKPRSCWGLILRTGRNSLRQPFVNVNFRVSFGNPGSL